MKITLLLLLLIALVTTASGVYFLRLASEADMRYYSAYNKMQEIVFEKDADEALQMAVVNLRLVDKDRGVSQAFGRMLVYISLGVIGLSIVPCILLFKRNK